MKNKSNEHFEFLEQKLRGLKTGNDNSDAFIIGFRSVIKNIVDIIVNKSFKNKKVYSQKHYYLLGIVTFDMKRGFIFYEYDSSNMDKTHNIDGFAHKAIWFGIICDENNNKNIKMICNITLFDHNEKVNNFMNNALINIMINNYNSLHNSFDTLDFLTATALSMENMSYDLLNKELNEQSKTNVILPENNEKILKFLNNNKLLYAMIFHKDYDKNYDKNYDNSISTPSTLIQSNTQQNIQQTIQQNVIYDS